MIQVTAQFDGVASFQAMAEEMARLTGRGRDTVSRNAARDFCRAAIRVTPMADPRAGKKRIANRGFAKSAWVGCLRKLGANVGAPGTRNPSRRTGELLMSEVVVVFGRDAGYIEVANQTPPIVALDQGNRWTPAHHIADRAMAATIQRMDRALQNLRARQETRWRR